MVKKFHISKHGVPASCNSPIKLCPYGDERAHFKTYEKAKAHADRINEAVKGNGNVKLATENAAQKIRSYYTSGTAINQFPLNKKIADLEDFDLVVVSWLTISGVRENMRLNKIGIAEFTYGDIVRILEEELKLRGVYIKGLELEKKYYNPSSFGVLEDQMKAQMYLYKDSLNNLAEELGHEKMEIISLPMIARKRLVQDGYLDNAENMNEVVYRVYPKISQFGDIIVYNHNSKTESKEFDVYEIAGVIEGKTLFELCYSRNLDSRFKEMWDSKIFDSKKINYNEARERYKKEQFFKGLEGTDIPKAFMRMSPIVAQEISGFVSTHRTIMMAIGNIISANGLDRETMPDKLQEEDDDWIIE